jgi:hypothetical protein
VAEEKGDLVTSRNLNLKDLTSQLHHHNVTVRKSTCFQQSS